MTPLTLARQVRELLAVPERWTQGAYARLADGRRVSTFHSKAASFCLAGAVYRNYGSAIGGAKALLDAFRRRLNMPLPEWHDDADRKHEDILRLVDTTIDGLEKYGA